MARKSESGIGFLIILCLMIVALPIVIIYWIIKAISKYNTQKNSVESNSYGTYSSETNSLNNKIFNNKTKDIIEKEAEEKYKRISDTMKQKHLRDRKVFLKSFNIVFSCISFFFGLVCLFATFGAEKIDIFTLILSIIFLIIGIILLIVMFVKLKQTDETLILEQLRRVLRKTYNNLTTQKVAQYKSYVKQNSPMYKSIKELNGNYDFDRKTCKSHHYHEYLNSKRQLDNFNYEKWIYQKMNEESEFFDNFEKIYENNLKKYNKYSSEYALLKNFRKEIEIESLELDYETFNYIEREIFNENKQSAITKPSISLEISYTSPSGRNHYSANHTYTYFDLLEMVKEKEEQEKQILVERKKKEKLVEEKLAKEKKLRELDKLEKKLAEKEQEINKKEKEFLEATKEHIYTTDNVAIDNAEIEIDENLTISQKMKLLREKFDNGEITYEEYQAKRKELM